jgi:NDP-sugar pyrophosphorylase family protein
MQIVILAAGMGTRMGELTRDTPKPLLNLAGKTLIEHKFDALPEIIEEIVLVVGYKGELIRDRFGDKYNGRKIVYVEDPTRTGTAHALWRAKDILTDKFLVCMGDDIYSKQAFVDSARNIPSIVCKRAERDETGGRVVLSAEGALTGFVTHKAYINQFPDGGLIFTGLYGLTKEIFNYEPVKLEMKEEWGLPQTVLKYTEDFPMYIIETDQWTSITSPEDLVKQV